MKGISLLAGLCLTLAILRPVSGQFARSLVIAFDVSESMANKIKAMREGAILLVDKVLESQKNQIRDFVFAPFPASLAGPHRITKDANEIKKWLGAVEFFHNPDDEKCPEDSMISLKNSLNAARKRSFVFVITDADPKDYELVPEVIEIAQAKRSWINVIVPDPLCHKTKYFEQITEATGGNYYGITDTDITPVLNALSKDLGPGGEIIQDHTYKPGVNTNPVPIDDTIPYLKVTLMCENGEIKVLNPDLTVSHEAKPLLNLKGIKAVEVENPETGLWKIETACKTDHRVTIVVTSSQEYHSGFALSKPGSMKDLQDFPIAGKTNYFAIAPQDPLSPITMKSMEIRSEHTRRSWPLSSVLFGTMYMSVFTPPSEPFQVMVHGVDSSGNAFLRTIATRIEAKKPKQPQIVGGEKEQFVEVGYKDARELSCRAVGEPTPTYKWFKNEEIIPREEGSVLLVSDNKPSVYRCEAENTLGKDEAMFHVNAGQTPKVLWSLMKDDNNTLVEYDKTTGKKFLTCPIVGFPKPEISWYVSVPNFYKYFSERDGYLLRIETQEGLKVETIIFKCEGVNIYGSVFVQFHLQMSKTHIG